MNRKMILSATHVAPKMHICLLPLALLFVCESQGFRDSGCLLLNIKELDGTKNIYIIHRYSTELVVCGLMWELLSFDHMPLRKGCR